MCGATRFERRADQGNMIFNQRDEWNRLWLGWMLANSAGFLIAWGVFSPLAHGLTGDHGDDLTLWQFVAHTVGLIEVGAVIALIQKIILRRLARVGNWSVWAMAFTMPVMFWIGYYAAGVPYDLLLSFTTIGVIGGLALRPHVHWGNQWLLANTSGFIAGFSIMAAATYPMADYLMGVRGGGLIGHTCLFLYIGAVGGAASGAITGLAMAILMRRSQQPKRAAKGGLL